MATNREAMDRLFNVLTGAVAVVAVFLGVLRVHQYLAPLPIPGELSRNVPRWQEYANSDFYLGRRPALVTIVEFSDFQCRYCKKSAAVIRSLREEFKDTVALVYRHAQLTPSAKGAAIATICAGTQGAAERMHDALFASSHAIGDRSWTSFALSAGIKDTIAFSRCLVSDASDSIARTDSVAAALLGVRGTPTFLVNGRLVEGSVGIEVFREIIRQALPDQSWYVRLRRRMQRSLS